MNDRASGGSPPTVVQHVTVWIAGALIALGVFGFVPVMTTGLSTLAWAGAESQAFLLGLLQVSVLHNVVHLVLGGVALAAAGRSAPARRFLFAGAAVYFALAAYGWLVHHGRAADFLPFNEAAGWLHLSLAFIMVTAAICSPGRAYGELRARRRSRI